MARETACASCNSITTLEEARQHVGECAHHGHRSRTLTPPLAPAQATDSSSLRLHASGSSHRLPRRVFIGAIVTPQTLLSIRVIKRGVLGVGSGGVIRFVHDLEDVELCHDEDRSATPVPIPAHAGRTAHHASGKEAEEQGQAEEMQLPPPALGDPPHANGNLSKQRSDEDKRIHAVLAKQGWVLSECEVVRLTADSFLCPGFIDTHIHAPQAPNMGLGQQYELLDWLQYITFPRERRFEDPLYARRTYEAVVERMLNSGTTCAAIYATLHEEATMILADICNEKGLRALVGKCQMDRNSPVDYIEKNPSASMEATKNFVSYCRNLPPYGTQPPAQSTSSSSASANQSPEMNGSIARLKATMDEMTDGGASTSSTDDGSSSSSVAAAEASSSTTSMSSSSSSIDHRQKVQASQRQSSSSVSSATSSLTRGSKETDSPLRVRERERDQANALVQPILTPRFAISCSDALLTSISAMVSRDPSLRIQTHLSENEGEIEFTKKLFPFASSYTDVYDHFSLLTPRTILAHAIHLDDHEMELLGKRKCGISHCPTSNNNLRSGVSRVGEMLNRGIKVGLGTDVSGGFGLSILTAIREASVVAKVLGFTSKNAPPGNGARSSKGVSAPLNDDEKQRTPAVGNHQVRQVETSGSELNRKRAEVDNYDFCDGPLSVATLFYLATLGGAEVCNLAHRVGSLETGKVRVEGVRLHFSPC